MAPSSQIIQTHEAETLYSFGQMLYEMASGRSLNAALMDEQCISVPPVGRIFLVTLMYSNVYF